MLRTTSKFNHSLPMPWAYRGNSLMLEKELRRIFDSTELSEDDREGRLANRSVLEEYERSLKDVFGSERGEMDEINEKGLNEYFVDGAYIRTLFIPAGVTIVSKLWKKERLWIIVYGEVTFLTEMGRRRVKAPLIEMAPFGTKVALYAHQDTLWCAITGAKADNSDDVVEEVTTEDYSELTYPWDLLEHKGDEL